MKIAAIKIGMCAIAKTPKMKIAAIIIVDMIKINTFSIVYRTFGYLSHSMTPQIAPSTKATTVSTPPMIAKVASSSPQSILS